MPKKNLYSPSAISHLDTLSIPDNLKPWDQYDLSFKFHAAHLEDWKKLYAANPDLGRKYVQAQTLSYIKQHKNLAVTKAQLVEFPKEAINFNEISESHKAATPARISIEPIDCLYAAQQLVQQGKKVAVLNMANQFHQGGGYQHGAGAQEEDLFRRTNLVDSLAAEFYPDNAHFPHEQHGFGEFNALYTKTVTVLRNGADKAYSFLDAKDQFSISVISNAAYNLKFSKVDPKSTAYLEGMKKKIIIELETAKQQGHTHLVLSAFGCGAFRNDPTTVAKLYKEVLEYPRYKSAFEQVSFAIIPNPGSKQDNYTPFKDVFFPKPSAKSHVSDSQSNFFLVASAVCIALLVGILAAQLSVFWGIATIVAGLTGLIFVREILRPDPKKSITTDSTPSVTVSTSSTNTIKDSLKPEKTLLFASKANAQSIPNSAASKKLSLASEKQQKFKL